MGDFFRIAALAVAAAAAGLLLKKHTPELGLLFGAAVSFVILLFVLTALQPVLAFWSELEELSGLSSAVTAPLLKCVGIAVMTKIAAELCRDAHEGAAAAALEFAGTAAALYIALPLLTAALKLVRELL